MDAGAKGDTGTGSRGPSGGLARQRSSLRSFFQLLRGEGTASTLLRGSGGAFAIKVGSAGIGFFVQILIARLLGAQSYGDYVYALTWQNLLILIGTMGFDTAALRFVAVYRGGADHSLLKGFLRHARSSTLLTSAAVAVLVSGGVILAGGGLREELRLALIWAMVLLPLGALLQLYSFNLLALKRVVLAQAPRDLVRPALLAAFVYLAIMTFGAPASAPTALAANVLAVALVLGVTATLLRRELPEGLDATMPAFRRREWTVVALPLLAISALQLLLERTDVLMIGMMISTDQAGIYAVAARISGLILFALSALNAVAAPLIADLHARGETRQLQRVVSLGTLGLVAFAVPTAVIMILTGPILLGLFGTEFQAGYLALSILAVTQVVDLSFGLVGFLLSMTGHQKEGAAVLLGSAVLNILLNALFIARWGIAGAAAATGLSVLIRGAVLTVYIWRNLGIVPLPVPTSIALRLAGRE